MQDLYDALIFGFCGQLENNEVTFFEQCTFCGADVT